MTKKFYILIALALVFAACNNQTKKAEEVAEIKEVTVEALAADPVSFDNQEVVFEGTVGHVCRHAGDKMRVMQTENTDFSILVMLGDFKGQITPESEGALVKVKGIVKTEVRNLDELATQHEHHDHEGEEEGHECSSTAEAIQLLKEKGIDPNIFVYIEITELEVK
jgi:hypothetical protein